MKPFARINLSSAALRRGILGSSLALERRGLAERVLMPDDGEEYSL